jgi:hypothetical protein
MANLQIVISQLRKEHSRISSQISRLEGAIRSLSALNGNAPTARRRGTRKMSASGKARIVAAQRKRWAVWRRSQKAA